MFAVAPILDDNKAAIAALALRINPEGEFTEILSVARSGETGETYAFNSEGVMLSNTRFPKDLVKIGLLDHESESGAILEVQLRDPGGNMLEGHRPEVPRKVLRPTRMAKSATSGESVS